MKLLRRLDERELDEEGRQTLDRRDEMLRLHLHLIQLLRSDDEHKVRKCLQLLEEEEEEQKKEAKWIHLPRCHCELHSTLLMITVFLGYLPAGPYK